MDVSVVMQRDEMMRLLKRVRSTTLRAEKANRARNAAIVEAFEAGVDRNKIAAAAGTTRSAVYQMVERESR